MSLLPKADSEKKPELLLPDEIYHDLGAQQHEQHREKMAYFFFIFRRFGLKSAPSLRKMSTRKILCLCPSTRQTAHLFRSMRHARPTVSCACSLWCARYGTLLP